MPLKRLKIFQDWRAWLAIFQSLQICVHAASPAIPADHPERMERGTAVFKSEVKAILMEHCLKCHGGEKTRGEFDLASRESLLRGGVNGPVVVPFQPAKSRILSLLRHAEEPHMPEKAPRLPESAVAVIERWIGDGVPYDQPLAARPAGAAADRSQVSDKDRSWWSFLPLAHATPPSRPEPHPIDRFLRDAAAAAGLEASPAADARTRLRRLHFGLVGLPPSREEMAGFLADPSEAAWRREIDRLLDSSGFGERWARHWLDVARFAESSGFEHDYDREGAFHYRDFVIQAFNSDLPFNQFVQWQIAGDETNPENPQALMATGFLGAGVFPTQITANEVERTRYDAMDDMLSTTGSAFLGLSVGCARCHDHKFDPIPTHDYYRLLSAFTTTVRSVIDLDIDPERTRTLKARWAANHQPHVDRLKQYEDTSRPRFEAWMQSMANSATANVWKQFEGARPTSKSGTTFRVIEDGSFLAEGRNADQDEYTFLGSTSLKRITALRLDAMADPSLPKGGPGRADNGNFALSRIRIWSISGTPETTNELRFFSAVADFQQDSKSLSANSSLDEDPKTGWAIDPQFGKDHSVLFRLAEPLEITESTHLQVRLEFRVNTRHNIGRPRISFTSSEAPSLDGEVASEQLARAWNTLREGASLKDLSSEALRVGFDVWKRQDPGWKSLHQELTRHAALEPSGKTKVLVCGEGFPPLRMNSQGADYFNETYFLKRGNTDHKAGVASPGYLQVLMRDRESEDRWKWNPPAEAKVSGRRRALASWLTDTEHGAGFLLARVIVNRLWQHHFGEGLVATPNDFGHTGAAPSHPALLDWLASELITNQWRLKSIHRLILTSAAYQQSSKPSETLASRDPANKHIMRYNARRLEGEALRDNILRVSGVLDPRMYGPGTKDEKSRRRSIYFTVKRSQLIGSMVAFDFPEPLVSQGTRPSTTIATQALFILNSPQVREWAEALAAKLLGNRQGTSGDWVRDAYLIALNRPPNSAELDASTRFLESQRMNHQSGNSPDPALHAVADFCQTLFGLNEFAYVY